MTLGVVGQAEPVPGSSVKPTESNDKTSVGT
jgi:hypothetical protein